MRYRSHWHTTSVAQQDGISTDSTWNGGENWQEETGIKQEYDN